MSDKVASGIGDPEMFRRIVDSSAVATAVFEGPSHRFCYVNAAYCRAVGVAAEVLLHHPAAEVFPSLSIIGAIATMDAVRSTGRTLSRRAVPVRLRADAPPTRWDIDHLPLRDAAGGILGVVMQAREVTSHVRARQAAEAADATLDALFRFIPEGLVLVDRDARIRRISRHALELLAGQGDVAVGVQWPMHPVYHLDGRLARPEELPLVRAVRQGDIVPQETWQLRRPDGEMMSILCSAGPIRDATGGVTGGVLAWRDVTELQHAEAALREALAARELLMREADHRIKNSLQLVAALLRLQVGRVQEATARAALEDAVARVQAVADAHRALQNTADLRHIGVEHMLRDVAAAAAALHPGADVVVSAPTLSLDAERAIPLALVLSELVTNALKHAYGPEGGRVELTARVEDTTLRVSVTDHGCGTIQAEGTSGLGSLVIRALAKQIGATLDIVATPGKGTRAGLLLPVQLDAPDAQDQGGSTPAAR